MIEKSNLMPKELSMSKADKRILLAKLEKYYATKLVWYQFFKDHQSKNMTPTAAERAERHYRLRIKAVETVLAELGSAFMKNVKSQNFRKTTTIEARNGGALQDKKSTLDYISSKRPERGTKI